MPVSELKNVLCKWCFAALLLPLAAIAIGYLMSLIVSILIIFTISHYSDLSIFGMLRFLASPLDAIHYVAMGLAMSIWLSPISSYLIAISAYAKKNPLVLSLSAPLIIIFFEKLFRGDSLIVNFILWVFPEDHSFEPIRSLLSTNIFPVALSCIVFLSLAVWLRNHRYEF